MKYTAKKLNATEWAVFTGKRYFTNTATTNELEAKQQAITMSIGFYEEQKLNAWDKLIELCGTDESGEVKLVGNDHTTNLGDLCC